MPQMRIWVVEFLERGKWTPKVGRAFRTRREAVANIREYQRWGGRGKARATSYESKGE